MQDSPRSDSLAPENFEALYQGKQPFGGVEVGLAAPPWDIGEPQPAVVALERIGQLRSNILDAGCGTGDNALFLAGRGYRVTGIDAAPTAIEQARQRAAAHGAEVEFVVADATRLEGFEQRFTTVLDSGLYHCLGDQERTAYASALHRVTDHGAQLHLFCFSDTESPGITMPNQVGHDDLHSHLGRQWNILDITRTDYAVAFSTEFLHRQHSGRFPLDIDVDALRTDVRGRVLVPMWHLHAVRRGDA